MRQTWRYILAVLVSLFALLSNGNVLACSLGVGHSMEPVDTSVQVMGNDMTTIRDGFSDGWETSVSNTIDCCSGNNHPSLLASVERPTEPKDTTVMPVIISEWKNSIPPDYDSSFLRSHRPPPDPLSKQDYASLVGIIKKLN